MIWPSLTHASGQSRLKSLQLVLLWAPFMDHRRFPRVHLRLIFLFMNVFLFLNCNFLAANIQTETVTVSSDEIVNSVAKLIGTRKTLAISQESVQLIRTAPREGSFFKRLADKQMQTLDGWNDLQRIKALGISNFVIFHDALEMLYAVSVLSYYAKQNGTVAFIQSTSFYEDLIGFQMRRNLPGERKRLINRGWESIQII